MNYPKPVANRGKMPAWLEIQRSAYATSIYEIIYGHLNEPPVCSLKYTLIDTDYQFTYRILPNKVK